MTTSLTDIRILISEGLFEEAEKRLMSYLAENPRDQEAIGHLAEVEKHLHLQNNLEVAVPRRAEALSELKAIAGELSTLDDLQKKELGAWLGTAPQSFFTDLGVMFGVCGLNEFWSVHLDADFPRFQNPEHGAEVCGWISRFFIEENHPLRARMWAERALVHLTGKAPDLELGKQLQVLHCRCLWESGERTLALLRMKEVAKAFPSDRDIAWLVEQYERDM